LPEEREKLALPVDAGTCARSCCLNSHAMGLSSAALCQPRAKRLGKRGDPWPCSK
jgi:hypothetical protein